MNRLLLAAIVLCGGLALAVIALPWLISSERVRASLHERAREITGREMSFSGDPKVAFSPFLGIEITDVSFKGGRDGAETLLTVPTLKGRLNVADALQGKVRVEEFQFVRPEFNLTVRSDGTTNWTFDDGEMWQVLEQAREIREATETGKEPEISKVLNVPLGTFSVLDGLIRYEDLRNGRTETITNFSGSLVWASTTSRWQFTGGGIWRGDQVSLTHSAETPIMLLAGGSSRVSASISSEPVTLKFDGEANRFSDLFLSGTINANSPSLRRTVNFFGGDAGTGASFSDFQASGKFAGTLKDLQLSEANLRLDSNQYTGSLRLGVTPDGGRRFSGTLASETINLAPYTSSLTTAEGVRSLFRISNGTEIDVRLSAKSVALDEVTIQDFAGGLIGKPGSFVLDIGNAALGEGLLVGQLTAAVEDDSARIGARIDATSVNPSVFNVLSKLSALSPSGSANIKIDMRSSVGEGETFENNIEGKFAISMTNGILRGVDFSQLRPSLEGVARPSENIEIGDTLAQTPVRDFLFQGDVNHGVAWITNSSFLIDDYRSRLSGKADLRSGNLAIWGLMQKQNEDGDWRSHTQYFLGGTLAEPLYVPQFTSRSPVSTDDTGGASETRSPGNTN